MALKCCAAAKEEENTKTHRICDMLREIEQQKKRR